MLKIDYDKASEFGPVEPGSYEVVVGKCEELEQRRINMQLIIRNDVEQKHKNRIVFNAVWKNKQTGLYPVGIINMLAKVLNIPNGQQFNSVNELCNAFLGKVALVRVEHEEYNGKTYERVREWKSSKFPNCQHVFKSSAGTNNFDESFSADAVSDKDLPF